VAFRVFADSLPKDERRWMKKRLRSLRQAASDARDLDVLGKRLEKAAEETASSRLRPLVERIVAYRRRAQKPLVTAYAKAKRKGFKKRSRALVKTISWQREEPEPTFRDAARTTLAPLVDKFLRAAQADLSDVETLHQMRIAGKRVRYAMELLSGAFDESSRGEFFAAFEEIQDKLGAINDLATAIALFKEWIERPDDDESRGELAELVAQEQGQLDAKCQEFFSWWTAARAEALELRFATVLRLPPPSPPREPLRLVV
jgi:CHAD domain-containing protein